MENQRIYHDNMQLINDTSFYWSVSMLRRLRDRGLITRAEYMKIFDMSAEYYNTELICK
jgi:DNA-binding HxlR family transcriptional regulator